jgi:phosphatidylinositol glycan class B
VVDPSPRTQRLIFLLAVAVHLATAWFSSGYYADDEHYQVITFAEVKAGHEPVDALPWEHAARIRSVVLPAVCLVLFNAADAIGLDDPFHKAFLLRLLTALAALVIVRRWTRAAMPLVPERLRTAFLLLSWFLWFLPFQHVRFTSETWSGLLLLAALTGLLAKAPDRAEMVRSGLLIGLAVLIRPPTLLMVMGLLGWALFTKRSGPAQLIALIASATMVHVLGAGLDTWWYGTPTYSPWNYALKGLDVEGGSIFEAFPWWAYGFMIIKDMLVPIGALACAAYALLWWKRPAGPVLWIITPFLLFHVFVPHKEMRFLFPLADLTPLMLVLAYASLGSAWRSGFQRKAWSLVLFVAAVANVLGLAVASFSPAGSGRTRLAEALGADVSEVRYDAHKFNVWKIAIPVFYGGPDDPMEKCIKPCGGPSLIITKDDPSCPEQRAAQLATADAEWASALLNWYHWRQQDRGWAAYRMTPVR